MRKRAKDPHAGADRGRWRGVLLPEVGGDHGMMAVERREMMVT
ncbi:MAG: hypothetical protein R6X25_02465 [Candidatus Krumholzibacteriia bacterium]